MALHNEWVAVQGMTKANLLDFFNMKEIADGPKERFWHPCCFYVELDNGWKMICSDKTSFLLEYDIVSLSLGALVLALVVDEVGKPYFTKATAARFGKPLWNVQAVGDQLFLAGPLPSEFDSIYQALTGADVLEADGWAFHAIPRALAERVSKVQFAAAYPNMVKIRSRGGWSAELAPRNFREERHKKFQWSTPTPWPWKTTAYFAAIVIAGILGWLGYI